MAEQPIGRMPDADLKGGFPSEAGHENRGGLILALEIYFRINPPCPAFGGVAPPKMKINFRIKKLIGFILNSDSWILDSRFLFSN
ncbi:MAG: hypothetical protein C0407_00135 [Desulfobacca sp.]|nr:hypothetical protein [Desulfobacca sp.]